MKLFARWWVWGIWDAWLVVLFVCGIELGSEVMAIECSSVLLVGLSEVIEIDYGDILLVELRFVAR